MASPPFGRLTVPVTRTPTWSSGTSSTAAPTASWTSSSDTVRQHPTGTLAVRMTSGVGDPGGVDGGNQAGRAASRPRWRRTVLGRRIEMSGPGAERASVK